MPFMENMRSCALCEAPLTDEKSRATQCPTCRHEHPSFDCLRSAALYEPPLEDLIKDFKFRGATWLCADLVDLLEGAVRTKFKFSEIDVVMGVPLHEKRLRERGYNQSDLLARDLAQRLNRRCDGRALVRTRETEHQARLSGAARRTNLEHAFEVIDSRWVVGRTILLIDDVTTTGSTLNHCAKALLKSGSRQVWCATVARSFLTYSLKENNA